MFYSLEEISRKDIIDVENGCRIGFVRDIEFGEDGKAKFLTIEKTSSKANPFRKGETVKINWNDIVVIGKETILVKNTEQIPCEPYKKTRLSDLF